MKVKTSELTGEQLDRAVAQCEGVSLDSFLSARQYSEHAYQYSTGWFQAGPIIEREKIELNLFGSGWMATLARKVFVSEEQGPTALIAAMRCYVASELGDEVEVPEEEQA